MSVRRLQRKVVVTVAALYLQLLDKPSGRKSMKRIIYCRTRHWRKFLHKISVDFVGSRVSPQIGDMRKHRYTLYRRTHTGIMHNFCQSWWREQCIWFSQGYKFNYIVITTKLVIISIYRYWFYISSEKIYSINRMRRFSMSLPCGYTCLTIHISGGKHLQRM